MTSLLLRNLLFTILQPGVVAGLIPYFLVREQIKTTLAVPIQLYHWIGIALIVSGALILLICIFDFARHGKGTLSPADPTKKLVVKGFYRYSRNPVYLAVMLILLGETIFMKSLKLGIYMSFVLAAFLLFIILFEEPRLYKTFGQDYAKYKERVGRWL